MQSSQPSAEMHSTTLVVLVSKDSVYKSELGAIWGEVWCQFGGHNFPEIHWNDLVVGVLIGWLEALGMLIAGSKRSATVFFMDGPFRVNIRMKGADSWEAEFMSDRVRNDELHRVEFFSRGLIESLIVAPGDILEASANRGWHSRDLDQLVVHRERLIQLKAKR